MRLLWKLLSFGLGGITFIFGLGLFGMILDKKKPMTLPQLAGCFMLVALSAYGAYSAHLRGISAEKAPIPSISSPVNTVLRNERVRIAVIGALIFSIGGILLMGLPGGLIVEGLSPIIKAMIAPSPLPELGDAAWPAAIITTLLWPWFWPASEYFLAKYGLTQFLRIVLISGFGLIWALILTWMPYSSKLR